MTFTTAMEHVAQGVEAFGVAILLVGLAWSFVTGATVWLRSRRARRAYRILRECVGGVLLLGLEVLVAADLIRTVAVAPTLDNVAVLGAIVLIRTFLSFSLEIEIEGMPPWRRALVTGAERTLLAAEHARDERGERWSAGTDDPRARDGPTDAT